MQAQVDLVCPTHAVREDCPDALISYSDKFREYGLVVHDGGSGSIRIGFCPWCGTKLPASLRDRWFEALAALGFEDPWEQDIPEAFHSDAWYRES